ncbi:hypothetical protein [Altererythrobacter fulvus]|uniref:hypothetical protein n=1 Tax=Caenibius fulvus TaxID=2126012 RepID=UPI00301A743C
MLTRNASWPGPNHGARFRLVQTRTRGELLLDDMERYRHTHRTGLRAICARAGVNESLIFRLRNGLNPRADIEKKVRDFMQRSAA